MTTGTLSLRFEVDRVEAELRRLRAERDEAVADLAREKEASRMLDEENERLRSALDAACSRGRP